MRWLLVAILAAFLVACANGSAGCITYRNHRFVASGDDTSTTLVGYGQLDKAMMAICK